MSQQNNPLKLIRPSWDNHLDTVNLDGHSCTSTHSDGKINNYQFQEKNNSGNKIIINLVVSYMFNPPNTDVPSSKNMMDEVHHTFFLFGSEDNCLVRRLASLPCILRYIVIHPSLVALSLTI